MSLLRTLRPVAAALVLLAAACGGPKPPPATPASAAPSAAAPAASSDAELRARLDACEQKQVETMGQLQALTTRVDDLEKRRAEAPQRKRHDPAVTYFVPVSSDDMSQGPKDARVVIVVAQEFACPYCAMLHQVLQDVLRKHPDVRLVTKQLVVHPDTATVAAHAACAAQRQGKYPAFEAALWKRAWPQGTGDRPQFQREQLTAESIDKIATEVGLELKRFRTDREGEGCRLLVARHRSELQPVGVSGTPTIFVNGRNYQGPRTVEAFTTLVDEARRAADEVVRKGETTAAGYYDHLMKTAQRSL